MAPTSPPPELFTLPPQPKKRPWKRIVGWTFLVGVLGVAGWLKFTPRGRMIAKEAPHAIAVGWNVKRHPNLLFDKVKDNHFNILLVGEDRDWKIQPVLNPRTGKYAPMNAIDKDAPPRSDTMIVLSLDRASHKMRLLSLPRDARVRFIDKDGDRRRVKLNAVYASGGKDPMTRRAVLKQFLDKEMGLRIDRVAVINIDGFTSLIDKIGGIQVDVDGALDRDPKTGKLYRGHIHRVDHWGQWSVDLDPGPQTLNGKQAQGYVRFRYDIEGDPGRIRRQQQVMSALAKKLKSQPLLQLPDLAQELRRRFTTDMDDTELVAAAYFGGGAKSAVKLQPMTPYGIYARNGDIILNKSDNEKLFGAIFGNSFKADDFLQISPSTEHDSIGHTNNGNPSAQEVLRAAGLAEAGSSKSNSILDAPVRK